MVEFPVNPTRLDPYKNFKFRLRWDGRLVAGISKMSGLKRTTEVVEHREGGDPSTSHKSPGVTRFEPITLERGLTQDRDFENWANLVWSLGGQISLANFRKEVTLEFYNEAGQLVIAYNIHRCWPSAYEPLLGLDANDAGVAIERIVLEHEGWERDPAVVEQPEA